MSLWPPWLLPPIDEADPVALGDAEQHPQFEQKCCWFLHRVVDGCLEIAFSGSNSPSVRHLCDEEDLLFALHVLTGYALASLRKQNRPLTSAMAIRDALVSLKKSELVLVVKRQVCCGSKGLLVKDWTESKFHEVELGF